MSSPSRTLTLKLLADTSKFARELRQAEGNLEGFGGKLRSFAAGSAKLLAGLTVAAGAAAVAVGRNLFEAFEEGEKAEAVIRNIVTQMGNFAGATDRVTKRITDQSEALAALTGVEDEVIAAGQGILLTFADINKTADVKGGIFDRATAATLDLQAAGFGNVESNATQLGKALQNPIKGLTALTRSGVDFTDAERDLIRALVESGDLLAAQDVILDAIEKQVGGTAAASASASDLIRVRFGLVRDELAEQLAPAFEAFSGFLLTTVIPQVEQFVEKFGPPILDAFQRVSDFVTGTLLPGIEPLLTFFRDEILPVIESFATYIVETVVPAVGDLVTWLRDNLGPVVEEAFGFFRDVALPAIQGLIDFIIVTVIPTLQNVFGPVLETLGEFIGRISDKITENSDTWARWGELLRPLFDFIRDDLAPILGFLLSNAVQTVGTAVEIVIDLFARWIDLVDAVIDKIKELARAVRDSPFGTAIGQIIDAVIPGRAAGGPVVGGRPYLVGERGPEVIVPRASGTVVPNHELGGGGITINVTGTVIDPEGTARAIQRVLLDSQRRVGALAAA